MDDAHYLAIKMLMFKHQIMTRAQENTSWLIAWALCKSRECGYQPFFRYAKATAPLVRKMTAINIPVNMRWNG